MAWISLYLTIIIHFGDRDQGYHSVNDESSVLYFEKDMKNGRKMVTYKLVI